MKQEFILDLESFHIMETVIELSGLNYNQFINACIHHYGEVVKDALSRIALSNVIDN